MGLWLVPHWAQQLCPGIKELRRAGPDFCPSPVVSQVYVLIKGFWVTRYSKLTQANSSEKCCGKNEGGIGRNPI